MHMAILTRIMMKHLKICLLFFLSFVLLSTVQAQDSLSTETSKRSQGSLRRQSDNNRNQASRKASSLSVSDSTRIFEDSLRVVLAKVDRHYLNNIVFASLLKEALNKQGKLESLRQLVKTNQKIASKDSIAMWSAKISNELVSLKNMQGTLGNYSESLQATKNQLQHVENSLAVKHKQIASNYVPLQRAKAEVQLKIDSLHQTQGKVQESVRGYGLLSPTLKVGATDPVVENSSSGSSKASIWKASAKTINKTVILDNIKSNYSKNKSVDKYVNKTEWTSRIVFLLLCLAYLYWVFKTNYALYQAKKSVGEPVLKFDLLSPIAKSFVFFLTLLPLVSMLTPTLVIQIAQLLLIVLFAILLRKEFSKQQAKLVGGLVFFYLMVIFVNSVVEDALIFRIICIVFNLLAIVLVTYIKNRIKESSSPGYINTPVYVVFILLNIVAIILNVLGHIDHSRSFSIAGAVGLMQSFTLKYFAEMMKLDVRRQFDKDRLVKGFFNRFNDQRTLKVISEILKFITFALAVIVLGNNLQFVDELYVFGEKLLLTTRKLGGISFTYGNLLVAILVTIIANWFQKNISLIVLGGENGQRNQEYNQKMTLFPVFRLIIIVVGFFFAISALGMSLDKLTVIIGALSVGIGLGMQNIINNFVSGIILVFDKPFRVGDQIELADKKGRVKEIGIRASVLQAGDGSEVIIPNGDLLSGRLVNWTLTHNYSYTSFVILVDRQAAFPEVTAWIKESMAKSSYCLADLGMNVSIRDIGVDMLYLNIGGWINLSTNNSLFKSDVLLDLEELFSAKGLKFSSIIPTVSAV